MKHHLFLLALSITLIFNNLSPLSAQAKLAFSDNPTAFLKELGDFVNQNKRPEVEQSYKAFSTKFLGTEAQDQTRMMNTCNAMLALKLSAYPYFTDYIESINVLDGKNANNVSRFAQWNEVVDAVVKEGQNKKIEAVRYFLTFSKNFFTKNAIFSGGNNVTWASDNNDYSFKYDKGTPSVEWQKLKLTASLKKDSIEIFETKGVFFPLTGQWRGTGGRITWARFGSNDTYCTIGDYAIDMTKGTYRAEKAKLHYPLMFPDRDIDGFFEDRLIVRTEKSETPYPRFESFDQKLKINNIGGNIQYEGGFRLYGTTVYGYGSGDSKANLTMNDAKRGSRNFRAAASSIAIRKGENIVGERVEAVIYFGKDSIYHPSVNLKLDIKKDELTLERGQRGGDRNPFYDSFHKMTMDVGKVKFDFAKDSLILGDKNAAFSTNNTKGVFESFQYYSEKDFEGFQGVATFNPISRIKIYSDNNNNRRTFSTEEFAKGVSPKLDSVSVQSMLFNLVAGGFINYDVDKQKVELKDKLFHFATASQKKADFDPLRMISESKQGNGAFSLRDTNLNVNGVRAVDLSVKQRVRVTPKGEEMIIKNNRNFDFNGKLTAGYGVFFGRDFHFNYDKYEIKTDSARFLDLYLPVGFDKYGNPSARVINSRVEHLKGVLLIDAPNNKSGREDIKMFPSFQSKDVSYVFYDDASIHDSVYNRDNFFFKLDKFNLDAMDSLTGKDLNFKGLFRSNDIFPDFRETLSLQKDSSLGLITKSPTEGYALYKGKGNYTGEIDLSNKGLLGRGSVKYLGASIESQDVLFYPNEMKSTAKKFHLEEDRVKNVPQIEGPGVNINWRPYQDSMYLTAQDSAFRFFKAGVHTLRSTIIMTPGGVKGIGTFDWDKGTLNSKMFSFGAYSVAADTMNMSIRALNNQATADLEAFNTKNIKGKIDFDEQRGRFKANSNDIQTFMPGVKYKTSINEFEWDLKEEDIDFKSDGREAAFLCVDPEQDSLRFFGTRASYDLKANLLKVGGVPYVQSCDANIYPKGEAVQIELGGKMTTFQNAKIVCDTLTKYHVINDATVNIRGKKLYDGTGFYEYNVGGKEQKIKFDNIVGQRIGRGSRAEKRTETRATGDVSLEDQFKIDYKTVFKGKISLFSNSKNLQFEGYAKLEHENLPNTQWFSINSPGDKKDLAIAFQSPKNEAGEPLYTGVYVSKENNVAYPRVMMPLSFRKDRQIIDVRGMFKYNNKTDELTFGDSSKVISNSPLGNKLVFQNKTGVVNIEGKLNLGSGLQYIKVLSAGRGKTNFLKPTEEQNDTSGVKAGPLSIEIMTGLDMFVPDKLLKIMAADIQSGSFDAADVEYTKDDFSERALATFVQDGEEYQKMVAEMKSKTLNLGDKYNKFNFLFSRVPMKWNRETQSFVSTAKRIDLNSVAGININKNIIAFLEYKMPSNEDDRAYVYIKTANDYFYFFGYQRGILSITSNNQKLEVEFNKIKPKERITKMSDNQPFEIQWVELGTAEMFLRRITNAQK